MEEKSRKRLRLVEEDEDLMSKLPESLLCEILVKLPTIDVVKTSLLSRRWRSLWKSVPGLDMNLDISNFDRFPSVEKYNFFHSFLLCLNSNLILQRIKVTIPGPYQNPQNQHGPYENPQNQHVVDTAILQNNRHLDLSSDGDHDRLLIPPTIYTSCEKLVSLKLRYVVLPTPISTPISLPNLKMMDLEMAQFGSNLDQEVLISGCLNLQKLIMKRISGVNIFRICSESLMEFSFTNWTHEEVFRFPKRSELVLNTPKLKCLKLDDDHFLEQVAIHGSCVKLINSIQEEYSLKVMNFGLQDSIQNTQIFPSFLMDISATKALTLSSDSFFQRIGRFLESESLPRFNNLTKLEVKGMNLESWDNLLSFLKYCPNLKSLHTKEVKSVEYGEINPRHEIMTKVLSYFENSTILLSIT